MQHRFFARVAGHDGALSAHSLKQQLFLTSLPPPSPIAFSLRDRVLVSSDEEFLSRPPPPDLSCSKSPARPFRSSNKTWNLAKTMAVLRHVGPAESLSNRAAIVPSLTRTEPHNVLVLRITVDATKNHLALSTNLHARELRGGSRQIVIGAPPTLSHFPSKERVWRFSRPMGTCWECGRTGSSSLATAECPTVKRTRCGLRVMGGSACRLCELPASRSCSSTMETRSRATATRLQRSHPLLGSRTW